MIGLEHGTLLVERFPFLTGSGTQVRELVLIPGSEAPPPAVIEERIKAAGDLAAAKKGERLGRS